MACRYYDDLGAMKLQKWLPENSKLRILKPDETKRLFETIADDNKDSKIKLPFIALSRNNDIELLLNIKNMKSFNGLVLNRTVWNEDKHMWEHENEGVTAHLNVIPIKLQYQMDIYTKTYDECDEYVRQYLFKLINNPVIKIEIPYNDAHIEHIANIRVLSTVSDTSAINERLFGGQFTRFTIQMEIHDAFLFSIPYKQNWVLAPDDGSDPDMAGELEISKHINEPGEIENLDFKIYKN